MTKLEKYAEQIVNQHVLLVATPMMDDLIGYAEDHPNEAGLDINEIYSHPRCTECYSLNIVSGEDYAEEHKDELTEEEYKEYCEYNYVCSDCGEKFDVADEYELEQEILEYWFVDDCLARALMNKNEVVFDMYGIYKIWGRTTSGQQIAADRVIEDIAKDWFKDELEENK